jgi:acyl dehydratase
MTILYFEEIKIGQVWKSTEYRVSREEIIEFASRWDPQPFHLDDEAAAQSIFGTLIASAPHTYAIQCYLIEKLDVRIALLAGLGTPRFELPHPVRPGDRLHLERRILAKRLSQSKPGRGIITTEDLLKNQDDRIVLDSRNNIMVSCRPAGKKG